MLQSPPPPKKTATCTQRAYCHCVVLVLTQHPPGARLAVQDVTPVTFVTASKHYEQLLSDRPHVLLSCWALMQTMHPEAFSHGPSSNMLCMLLGEPSLAHTIYAALHKRVTESHGALACMSLLHPHYVPALVSLCLSPHSQPARVQVHCGRHGFTGCAALSSQHLQPGSAAPEILLAVSCRLHYSWTLGGDRCVTMWCVPACLLEVLTGLAASTVFY